MKRTIGVSAVSILLALAPVRAAAEERILGKLGELQQVKRTRPDTTIVLWGCMVGPNNQSLYYLLEWNSLAEREQKWAAFASDPEWIAKRAETEKNGQIVERIENMFLAPTAYSKVK